MIDLDDVFKVVICVIAFDVILLANLVEVDSVETVLASPWVICIKLMSY